MNLTINGTFKEMPASINLTAVVTQFCKNPKHVIVEVNGNIVPTAAWDTTSLKDGDNLELVTFVGGG